MVLLIQGCTLTLQHTLTHALARCTHPVQPSQALFSVDLGEEPQAALTGAVGGSGTTLHPHLHKSRSLFEAINTADT